jgi:hypothetical protein
MKTTSAQKQSIHAILTFQRQYIHLNARLGQLQSDCQRFSYDHIRIVTAGERPFQLLHLPRREVSAHASSSSGSLLLLLIDGFLLCFR